MPPISMQAEKHGRERKTIVAAASPTGPSMAIEPRIQSTAITAVSCSSFLAGCTDIHDARLARGLILNRRSPSMIEVSLRRIC